MTIWIGVLLSRWRWVLARLPVTTIGPSETLDAFAAVEAGGADAAAAVVPDAGTGAAALAVSFTTALCALAGAGAPSASQDPMPRMTAPLVSIFLFIACGRFHAGDAFGRVCCARRIFGCFLDRATLVKALMLAWGIMAIYR